MIWTILIQTIMAGGLLVVTVFIASVVGLNSEDRRLYAEISEKVENKHDARIRRR